VIISRFFVCVTDEADAVTDQMEAPISPPLQQKKEKLSYLKKD